MKGLRRANILGIELTQVGRANLQYTLTYDNNTRPFVILSFPFQGQTNVAAGSVVTFVFSEPILALVSADVAIYNVTTAATVSVLSYTIDSSGAGTSTGGIIRILDSGGYQLANNIYQITLKTTIRDLAGTTMEENYVLTFGVAGTGISGQTPTQGQRALFAAASTTKIITTVQAYATEPYINALPVANGAIGISRDDDMAQIGGGDDRWTFTLRLDDPAPTGGQIVDIIEAGTIA
ncbi:MAG TPA: Ig-like domain-containing protein [Anaerolineae bacterium]|nr:Ig-like domain-containing protein [Anaerolineae bacterium]